MRTCQLCERPFDYSYGKDRRRFSTGPPTAHHLVPKQKGGKKGERIFLCIPCHKQLHKMFDSGLLKRDYSTLEKLRASDRVKNWMKWVSKK